MPTDEIPLELEVEDVQALRAAGTPFILLDCREPDEHATASLPGALLIPMREIPERLSMLEPHRDGRIVVHCHHGGRSLRVARWLRGQGFVHAQSMAGGIDQWAQQIDTSLPRY